MKPVSTGAAILGALALAACVGTIGDGGSPSGPGGPGGAADAGPPGVDTDAAVGDLPLRRLTRIELTNTIADLTTAMLADAAPTALGELAPTLSQYPADAPVGLPNDPARGAGFTRLDQSVIQEHVDALYAIGSAFAVALTGTPERMTRAVGSCASDADTSNDAVCLDAFVHKLGELVLRRPVTAEDATFYASVATLPLSPLGVQPVVALLLDAPDFAFHVENGDPSATGVVAPLTAYELASRISYHFWETMPDAELRAAAKDGTLLQPGVLAKEVARLMADPRASAPLAAFYAQWLRVNRLPALDAQLGTPIFRTLAGADLGVIGPATTGNAITEVTDAAEWITRHGGTLGDLLTNRQSFAKTPDIAQLYGVPVWDGTSTPPTFTDPARAGLLTRIAFLASGYVDTNPILKGVGLREALLCDTLGRPPAAAANASVTLSPTQTTREQTEALTSPPLCAGCHATLINPLGFATENFDALGRARTRETLFDRFGNMIGTKPIDTVTIPQIRQGDTTASRGAGDLTRLMMSSGKVAACFATNYFRYVFGRLETPEDAPVIASLVAQTTGGALAGAMKSVVTQPAFLTKSFR